MKRLVLIVNFNQELELANTLDDVLAHVPREEIILVDDGSTDRSADLAALRGIEVIRHGTNRGVGAAIRTGIQYGIQKGFEYVVIFSSNGKMCADQIDRISEPVESGRADYAQGSRFAQGGEVLRLPILRRILIPLFSLLVRPLLGRSFSDITCGFRAYRLDWLQRPPLKIDQAWLDRYEMEYYLHYYACALGVRMEEVPVTIRYSHLEKNRQSKIRLSRSGWSIVRTFVLLPLRLRN